MNSIEYKKAKLSDIEEVTMLLNKLYASIQIEVDTYEENQHFLISTTQAFFLATINKQAIGIAHVSKRLEYVEGSDNDICGYLEAVYTLPDYRFQGVAKDLVKECENWSQKNGCTLFASDCQLENVESYQFHLKIGFHEVSRNIHFVKDL